MPPLRAALVPAPDRVVVRLTGDADLSTATLLTDALTRAARLGTSQVLVDIAGARFWDCSGLHVLTSFVRRLAATGRDCRLVGIPSATRALIGAALLTAALGLVPPTRPAARSGPPEDTSDQDVRPNRVVVAEPPVAHTAVPGEALEIGTPYRRLG